MSKNHTFKIVVYGIGGEISAGHVERATYDYFKENDIDIDDYYNDYDNELNIPEEHQFVEHGCFFQCDDFAHETGCEVHEDNTIEVFDQDNNLLWSQNLDIEKLVKDNVQIEQNVLFDRDDEPEGTCIYVGQSIEKGVFNDWTITSKNIFDPKKLTLVIDEIDGWSLLTNIRYDDDEMENDGPDTRGKSFEQKLFMIGE